MFKKTLNILLSMFILGIIFVYLPTEAKELSSCIKSLDNACTGVQPINTHKKHHKNNFANTIKSYDKTKMTCYKGYGFRYIMDPYYITRNKFWISYIEPDSNVQRAGLKVGDEILKVNEQKVNFMDINKFNNAISANHITLRIKNKSGKKDISITSSNTCQPIIKKDNDETFNAYWTQIYTGEDTEEILPFLMDASRVYKKLSHKFKLHLLELSNKVSYWHPKKVKFKNGYNLCKANYKSDTARHSCISNLINREIAQIQHDEYLRQQQMIFEAQLLMQQQQINAMNRYSNALQNQNVHVQGDVGVKMQHGGTVNIKHHW